MEQPLDSTWGRRELPILRTALSRHDRGETIVDFLDLQADTGLSRDELLTGLRALATAQPAYLELSGRDVLAISERARRELGTWPSPGSLVDALAAAIAQAAEAEREPEKKRRLRAVAEDVAGVARDIAVAVVATKIGDI